MRKHKNLNKQELMIRQDIPCVHLGGKFVPLKSRVKSLLGEKRKKLSALLRVYFQKGGQEMQINATSREVLKDAMAHPENYPQLVVRVSGFSALFVTLDRDVQEDILRRTQQG